MNTCTCVYVYAFVSWVNYKILFNSSFPWEQLEAKLTALSLPCLSHLEDPSQINFPGGSDGKASAYNSGDPGSIPRLGRSPGEGNSNPLHYSCLENPMDGGAW